MFDSYHEKVIISIIIGFGLSTLFRRVCKNRNCIIIKGPSIEEVEKKVYKSEKGCYSFKSVDTEC